ncbi:MAG: hypothetical protein Hals2KO_04960 [Halioglobus sp.]
MKYLAITLILGSLIAPAQVLAGDGPSLHCGVSLGGTELTQRRVSKSDKGLSQLQYLPGPQVAKLVGRSTPPSFKKTSRPSRLPATFTIAIIGCTWR